MLLGKKINITINQDVDKIFSTIDHLKQKIKNKDYDFEHLMGENRGDNWKEGYDGATYAWGTKTYNDSTRQGYAHMMVIHEHSHDGAWLYGPIMNHLCPWIDQLKDLTKDLNFVEVGVMQHSGDVIPHLDDPGGEQEQMCRLVTVLYQEDQSAHLTAWHSDWDHIPLLRESAEARQEIEHEHFYLDPGESYALNIKIPHAVYNTKKRLILSARFDNTVEEVVNHFESLGPVTIG